MNYPSIDKLLNICGSKYTIAVIASERSKEIERTGHLQMEEREYLSKKNIGKALEEIVAGYIIVNEDN